MPGQKITKARKATLEEIGEDRIFALYVEHGSVARVMGEVLGKPDGASESWGRRDFYKWLRADPERWQRWQEAKQDRGHVEADKVGEIADGVTSETASADRVKISAYQWRAERLNRAEFGPPQAQVNVGVGVQIGQAWLAALQAMQDK